MNKASGGDDIPVELLQILKDDAVKVLKSICQQIWKTAVATELEKISFHSNPKERQCQIMFKLLHNYDRKLSISIACYQNTYGQNISLCLWISKMRLCWLNFWPTRRGKWSQQKLLLHSFFSSALHPFHSRISAKTGISIWGRGNERILGCTSGPLRLLLQRNSCSSCLIG